MLQISIFKLIDVPVFRISYKQMIWKIGEMIKIKGLRWKFFKNRLLYYVYVLWLFHIFFLTKFSNLKILYFFQIWFSDAMVHCFQMFNNNRKLSYVEKCSDECHSPKIYNSLSYDKYLFFLFGSWEMGFMIHLTLPICIPLALSNFSKK